jgi:hypothetical protein
MKFYYRNKLPWKQALAFIILSALLAYWGYYVAGNSPEFQLEAPKQFFKTRVIRTICGPCFASNEDEYLHCGARIGRYQSLYADGKCRHDLEGIDWRIR